MLWRPERAMLYAVAIYIDTFSNQAIKDPGQRRCGYSNLGKIIVKSVAHVGLRRLWLRGRICRKIPLPDILRAEQKVVPLIPACSILPLFDFVEAGISTIAGVSTTADNLS